MVYVDGFNLYHGLHSKYGRKYLWLDLVQLATQLRPQQQLIQVKYFTAPVLNDPQAQSRQDHYLNALRAKHPQQISIILGRYQTKKKTCFNCGHTYIHYEEKETDVNMATSLVVDAANKEFDTALLVTADSDMAPAVRATQSIHPQGFVAAAFPPDRRSYELSNLMPSSFPIYEKKLKKSQLEEKFTIGNVPYQRPQKWS
ncbi:NYN domain [Mycobacteroides abscessus subsp. abscessus]|nr:NYN domain-containing protein [Dermabacter vaginalis]SHW95674.1 NYN domain [Mycobacteroides abscessus subsp. abscessus]